MQTPIILLGPTAAGGSIIPVVGSASGDLRGLTLLGSNNTGLVIETSLDAITWAAAAFPLILVDGFLRLTRLSDSPLASVIYTSAPDPAPATPAGLLPLGGATGEVLAKSAAGDFQTEWVAAAAGGGTGPGGLAFLSAGVTTMVYPANGTNKYFADVASIVIRKVPAYGSPLPGGIYNSFTTPFPTLEVGNLGDLTINDADGNQVANFSNLNVPELSVDTVGGVVRVNFPPALVPPGCSFRLSLATPIQILIKNGEVGSTERMSLYSRDGNGDDQLIAGVLPVALGGPAASVFDGPSGNYMVPYTTGPRASNTGTDGILPGHTSLVVPPDGSKPFFQVFGGDYNSFHVVGTRSGPSASRPGYGFVATGDQYFDTTLHKPLWYDGGWRDATGTLV